MIPTISVSSGKPTMFFPLITVVLVSMVKDFFEDWKRRVSDKKENESEIEVLNELGFCKTKSQSIYVGSIIRINRDEYFPCDVLLLKHGLEDKMVYVETKNLDGETNLKLKKVPQALNFLEKELPDEMANLQLELEYEKPNPFILSFNGNLKLNNKKYALEASNLILRGCSLKINSYAIGLCLYNGHETKIMMNAGNSHPKKSSLERELNKYFKFICLFQIIVTLVCSLIYGLIVSINFSSLGYVKESPLFIMDTVSGWGSWFISLANFIPISLLVTVEMIRYGQGYFLSRDPLCSSKGYFTEVQTSSVNEELGQLEYILSDKTGTLTQNLMEFKCICIGNQSYGNPEIRGNLNESMADNSIITDELSVGGSSFREIEEKIMKSVEERNLMKNVDFDFEEKEKLLSDLKSEVESFGEENSPIHNSLLHLALCHNVIKEKESGQYSSSSPDELALVSFAKYIGFVFIEKNDDNMMVIQKGNETLMFKLLYTLEFSSERKRMSVIIENEKGEIVLLCKGADDIIIERSLCTEEEQQDLCNHLSKYAFEGLRTLVLSFRSLNKEEFNEWKVKYDEALTTVGSDRMDRIFELQSDIEKEMTILGATAIEDKLQSEVKETITDLKKAGIKVWMLTGDKKETAVSIGYSCGLIDETCEKITFDCEYEQAEVLINNIESMLHYIKDDKVTIICGEILRKIKDETLAKLTKILRMSSSVICCRVSPKDKETLTKMVKEWGRTLAVGDGANDVNMINTAHVGVGVKGIEGSQATRAADYVISEFKILKRLITYYGINFYYRNSNVILYNLFKNIAVTFPLIAFGPLSIFSSTYIYEAWIFQFFNIFFSSLPIIIFGLFNVKFDVKAIEDNPQVYLFGRENRFFNGKKLLSLFSTTCILAAIIVYLTYFSNELSLLGEGYMSFEIWSGMTIFNIVVISINLRIYLISNQISVILVIASLLSVLSYYWFFFLIGTIFNSDCKNVLKNQMNNNVFWLLIFAGVSLMEGFEWTVSKIWNSSIENSSSNLELELSEDRNSSEVANDEKMKFEDVFEEKNVKIKRILSENSNSGGYAFAEDEQRSLQNI